VGPGLIRTGFRRIGSSAPARTLYHANATGRLGLGACWRFNPCWIDLSFEKQKLEPDPTTSCFHQDVLFETDAYFGASHPRGRVSSGGWAHGGVPLPAGEVPAAAGTGAWGVRKASPVPGARPYEGALPGVHCPIPGRHSSIGNEHRAGPTCGSTACRWIAEEGTVQRNGLTGPYNAPKSWASGRRPQSLECSSPKKLSLCRRKARTSTRSWGYPRWGPTRLQSGTDSRPPTPEASGATPQRSLSRGAKDLPEQPSGPPWLLCETPPSRLAESWSPYVSLGQRAAALPSAPRLSTEPPATR